MQEIPLGAALTRKELARRLDISVSTVGRWVQEGKLSRPRRNASGKPTWFECDIAVYHLRVARGDFDGPPPELPEEDDDG